MITQDKKVVVEVAVKFSFDYTSDQIKEILENIEAVRSQADHDVDKELLALLDQQGIDAFLKEVSKMIVVETLKEEGVDELLEIDFLEGKKVVMEEMKVEVK